MTTTPSEQPGPRARPFADTTCPKCAAPPGEPCRSESGAPLASRAQHRARFGEPITRHTLKAQNNYLRQRIIGQAKEIDRLKKERRRMAAIMRELREAIERVGGP